jgi:uncharacterized protein (DUF849 family)
MAEPVIVTCAVTGGAPTAGKYPAVPVTPEQIANAVIEARNAGAAVAHVHVRDPRTGLASMDVALYREVVERVRGARCDILINLTTGPGSRFIPSDDDPRVGGPGTTMRKPLDRVQHVVELLPDICSLDVGSMNFGETGFVNTPAHLRVMAKAIADTGVKPELEVFEPGHIMLARKLIEEGVLASPPLFQICLGIPYGAPATSESMMFMKSLLPADAMWASFGISRAEFPMVAQAAILGGHVRVGLEDNLYLEHGVLASGNGVLVERAVVILRAIGKEAASPEEARRILGLGAPRAARVA